MADLGSLFSQAWTNTIDNIKEIFLATLFLLGLPIFVVFLMLAYVQGISQIALAIVALCSIVLMIVLYFIFDSGMIRVLLLSQKITYKAIKKEGINYAPKLFGVKFLVFIIYVAIIAVFILPVVLAFTELKWTALLIAIPLFFIFLAVAITLGVYLTFCAYLALDNKTSIMLSLRKSAQLVKGRFWQVLGYSIVVGLFIGGISGIVNIVLLPLRIATEYFIGINQLQIAFILSACYYFFIALIYGLTRSFSYSFMAHYYKELITKDPKYNLRIQRRN